MSQKNTNLIGLPTGNWGISVWRFREYITWLYSNRSSNGPAHPNPIRNLLCLSMTPAQYLISLCTTAQQSDQSFGIAIRIGTSNSKFQFEATNVIHSILMFSPAPDTMAVEFLNELEKVEGISSLGKFSLHSCILLLIRSSDSQTGFGSCVSVRLFDLGHKGYRLPMWQIFTESALRGTQTSHQPCHRNAIPSSYR